MSKLTPKKFSKRQIEIEYSEHTLDQVIRYFANGYVPQEGKVTSHEAFVDTAKNKVVFKLFIEKDVSPHN